MGQCLRMIMDSWSNGQAEESDLHLLIAAATWLYVGHSAVEPTAVVEGSGRILNQGGAENDLFLSG